MLNHLPKAIPETLVIDFHKAAEYYVNALGFRLGLDEITYTNQALREHYNLPE